jgi:ABC-2 family transporter protein
VADPENPRAGLREVQPNAPGVPVLLRRISAGQAAQNAQRHRQDDDPPAHTWPEHADQRHATVGGRLFRGLGAGLRHAGALLDAGDIHPGRSGYAHIAERIRLLSLRSTHCFLACSVLIAVAAACLLSAKLNIQPVDRASYPSLDDAFNADTGGLLMTIAACFGASIMTGEYSSGLIRVTFTASPARERVMLAKTLALAAVAGIAGTVATAAAVLASQVILSSGHYAGPFSQPGGLRAAATFTLLMSLGAITGLAFGAVLRRPVIAVAVVAVLTLLPSLVTPDWPGHDGLRCLVHPCQPAGSRHASFRPRLMACPLRLGGDRVHARHRPRPAAVTC